MTEPQTTRLMLATVRDELEKTEVIRDTLPPLEQDEIRLRVDKVGLSANNLFYLQMGEAPFLKFFHVYPLGPEHKHLANMPAWGIGTVIASENDDFAVGEKFTGFLQLTNVVQMKARRSDQGFTAYGGNRDKLNPAYNGFTAVSAGRNSPIRGEGDKADLAMTASPGALSGFVLFELLRMNDYYGGNSVVLTSASSKLSLATALLLQEARSQGRIDKVIGYASERNRDFVTDTGLYDEVLSFDQDLPAGTGLKHVLIDVAGDAQVFKRNQAAIIKGLAVGGTHGDADSSTFTAFRPSGFLKMFIDMMGPAWMKRWAERRLSPTLEMFFAPTVINSLLERWCREEMDRRSDDALRRFVDAAVDGGWIKVTRAEDIPSTQAAYQQVISGAISPSDAVIISLT